VKQVTIGKIDACYLPGRPGNRARATCVTRRIAPNEQPHTSSGGIEGQQRYNIEADSRCRVFGRNRDLHHGLGLSVRLAYRQAGEMVVGLVQ
jgi:hypothetical protein